MLFHLKFGVNHLLGVIGKNSCLYWDSSSVSDMLGYKSQYYFGRHHSIKCIEDVASDYFIKMCNKRDLKTKVIEHDKFLFHLQKAKKMKENSKVMYNYLRKCNFFVLVYDQRRYYPFLNMCYTGTVDAIKFKVWLEKYNAYIMRVNNPAVKSPIVIAPLPLPVPTSPPPSPSGSTILQTVEAASPQYSPPSPSGSTILQTVEDASPQYSPPSPSGSTILQKFQAASPQYSPSLSTSAGVTAFSSSPETLKYSSDSKRRNAAPYSSTCTCYQEELLKKAASASSGGFTFWVDSIPPTKIYLTEGSELKKYLLQT